LIAPTRRYGGGEVTPKVQGTWLGCGAGLAGVVVTRLAGIAMGVSAAVVVFWVGVVLLPWRFDRQ